MKACKQTLVFALLATAMTAPQLAHGQTTELAPPDDNFHRDRNMSVTERIQPGYEQVPLTLGSFDVLPSFTSGLAFDDNVFAEPVGKSDVYGIIRSDVNIQSNWSSNFLQATGFVEYDPYATYGQEDAVPRGATIDGRYDISHGFYLSGLATYQNLVEPRTNSGAPTFTESPVQYDETIFEGDISKTFNRVRLQLDAKRDAYAYDTAQTVTGAPVVLEYRNDAIYTITGRAEYAVTPVYVGLHRGDRQRPCLQHSERRSFQLQSQLAGLGGDRRSQHRSGGAGDRRAEPWIPQPELQRSPAPDRGRPRRACETRILPDRADQRHAAGRPYIRRTRRSHPARFTSTPL